jgi:Flp pilus assembly protein TadG
MKLRRLKSQKGTALLEAAITMPMLLLVAVGIFEFGRAYQTWQVLTNAAREAGRVAVTPYATSGAPESRARQYMQNGQLPNWASAGVSVSSTTITVNGVAEPASQVTINYPFSFIMLQPVARLVQPATSLGAPLTMTASIVMRNE